MSITDFQNGLAAKSGKKVKKLFFVTAALFDDWYKGLDDTGRSWVTANGFRPASGSCLTLPAPNGDIAAAVVMADPVLVWQTAAAAASLPAGIWQPCLAYAPDASLDEIQLGWGLAQYHFAPHRKKPTDSRAQLWLDKRQTDRLVDAQLQGITIAREMINQPANIMTVAGIEKAAREIAASFDAKIKVTKGKALERSSPAIHIVGRAAEIQPRLIDIRWGRKGPVITLVGKGISFDSGGLDMKPSRAMELMKKDMGGAAHVLGLAAAIMKAGLKVRLRVLVAAAENAVSERAMRPLDVIDTAAGIAVEVGNTDAEGRLVLADALYHALNDKGCPPPHFIADFATLTGAARVALGTECPALFCNSQETGQELMRLGGELNDPVWQLPLFEDYERFLDNGQAGLSSTGNSGYGGAITAALFLRRFVGRTANWAHLDVMAWNLSARPGRPRGGEAMGLRTLFAYIRDFEQNSR